MPKTKNKLSRNETLRLRYKFYRDLGYSSKEASKLRSRSLDISTLKVTTDKKTKEKRFVKNKEYRELKKVYKDDKVYNDYREKTKNHKKDNFMIISDYAFLTYHDEDNYYKMNKEQKNKVKFYQNETSKMVKYIEKDMNATNDQAYYLLYYMYIHDVTYSQAKMQMKYDPTWEEYKRAKEFRARRKRRK